MRRLSSLLAFVLILAVGAPAFAGVVNVKKLKKWPKEDVAWARSFDVFMSDDELEVFLKLATTEERRSFLVQAGFWSMWEGIDEELLPAVLEGRVEKGMSQDEVYMCWDKPGKIRKDFKKEAYVDILHYDFEVDRKGREFLLLEGSETAYKNEVLVKQVYMHNGAVFRVVDAGKEENVLDDLLEEQKRLAAEKDAAKPVFDDEDEADEADGEDTPAPTPDPAPTPAPAPDPAPTP